jgi:hypothetical protein
LRLGEDRGSPERAHDGDGSRAEEFSDDRSDRRSREAAVGPVNDEAFRRFSRRWWWGWRWTEAACLRWLVGGGGARRCQLGGVVGDVDGVVAELPWGGMVLTDTVVRPNVH